jgi:hypothetical protein
VLDYCQKDDLPSGLEGVVEDLTVIRYRKMGSEGVKSESVGPLGTTYEDGADSIPESYKRILRRYLPAKFR